MDPSIPISSGPSGAVVALACIVAGGPLFAAGLRAWRARFALDRLRADADGALAPGLQLVHGPVALDGPMFAPLSGRPCAGFTLEVRDESGALAGTLHEGRAFTLRTFAGDVRVEAGAEWRVAITDERTFGSGAELTERLSAMLAQVPELRWRMQRGRPLILMERALVAGRDAWVVGCLALEAPVYRAGAEVARTGTGDEEPLPEGGDAEWCAGAGPEFDRAIVSDRRPEPRDLAPASWKVAGVALGPALALGGLLHLAQVLGTSMGGGAR